MSLFFSVIEAKDFIKFEISFQQNENLFLKFSNEELMRLDI
jgi:hypothetical protein